jgi:hypothetical protein
LEENSREFASEMDSAMEMKVANPSLLTQGIMLKSPKGGKKHND